ncbi:hypothetical protein [Escherichia coli]|uniref:hypothetical protein n=1 Tax=Escherichia coli TaxID=562 RepID=UPI001C701570|nr:hypothetical protein [Escherichia coli]
MRNERKTGSASGRHATDPAGNRLPDPELHPDSTLSMWPDNRIARDAHYLYR